LRIGLVEVFRLQVNDATLANDDEVCSGLPGDFACALGGAAKCL
jgi:hypothetical protein